MYAIRLRTKNGRRVTLADEITSRQEARWVVSQIEALAGLKIDTHVEVDSLYGPPPQPGQPLFNPSRPGSLGPGAMRARWQQPRPQSRASTVISIAIFVMFAGGMFAWQGLAILDVEGCGKRCARKQSTTQMEHAWPRQRTRLRRTAFMRHR